jgi:asparagine N-glycosylation enzyme membrane subunit Stt3
MRKLAILGLIILIALVVLVTLASINFMGIRDTIYGAIQGTILQPGHDWIVNSWIQIGALGFTYIAAASLALAIGGGLIMVFIVYGLFWQKLIQGKILHKTAPSPIAPMQRTLSTPLTPTQETVPIPEKKEET